MLDGQQPIVQIVRGEESMGKVIGLTGGIGSGKSVVSCYLEDLGYQIVDADLVAREVVAPNTEGLDSLVKIFGQGILTEGGELNRQALGKLIFRDEEKRLIVNRLLHPLIERVIAKRLKKLKERHTLTFLVVPLFFEAGYAKYVDDVWYVYASKVLRENRVSERDKIDSDYAKRKIDSQLTLEEVQKKYQIRIIDNEGSIDDLKEKIDKLLPLYLEK